MAATLPSSRDERITQTDSITISRIRSSLFELTSDSSNEDAICEHIDHIERLYLAVLKNKDRDIKDLQARNEALVTNRDRNFLDAAKAQRISKAWRLIYFETFKEFYVEGEEELEYEQRA